MARSRMTFQITFPRAMVETAIAEDRVSVLGGDGRPMPGTPRELARLPSEQPIQLGDSRHRDE